MGTKMVLRQTNLDNYLFKFPFAGYGYAICGGPDSSVFAAMGEWIFICDTPHNTDASDSRNATCVSDAPSETYTQLVNGFMV